MADLAGYYPSYPAPNSVEIKTNSPGLITNTFSGRALRTAQGGQWYELTLKYSSMKQIDFRGIHGFMAQGYGSTLSFEVVLPEISYTTSVNPPSTVVRVNGALTKGVKTATLENCGANKIVLNGGDYFKFDNHSKVYQATNDCISDAAGAATLYFAGSLINAVPDNTNLTITAVPFTMIFSENNNTVNTGIGGISTMNVSMREVW
jgi:hypothetical protein